MKENEEAHDLVKNEQGKQHEAEVKSKWNDVSRDKIKPLHALTIRSHEKHSQINENRAYSVADCFAYHLKL